MVRNEMKHMTDGAAVISGVGSFTATTLATLQGVSLILAIVASLFSIAWIVYRFYQSIKNGKDE